MTSTRQPTSATAPAPRIVDLDRASVAALAPALLELQRASYAVEARLIADDRIPPLHEGLDALLAAELSWSASLDDDGAPLGAIGYAVEGDTVDIDRLMVHPAAHRRGIGRRLVRHALTKAPRAIVATGRDNRPARELYERLGFEALDEVEVIPGLWIARYARPSG